MSDTRTVELPHPLAETVSDFQMPRFNRPPSLQRQPFEPMAVRMASKDKSPMAVKIHHLPYLGYVLDPDYQGMIKRLGFTVGVLTVAAAIGFFIARPLQMPNNQAQTETSVAAETSQTAKILEARENRIFLEEFLFEGFTKDEMKKASEKIVIYMRQPDTIREAARNLAQNIQGISSENLRPLDESKLDEMILLHLSETMPDASPAEKGVRAKLLKAIFAEESNSRPGIVNTAEDATGLGQITPASFKEVLKRFKQNNPDIYQKYFSDIEIDLESDGISPEEKEILIGKLKDPNINILASDELLRYYSKLHSSASMGLMAYGSNPNDLAQAEEAYAILVGKDNPIQVERDFKGVDEEDNFDPDKPPATKTYTKRFSLNPIKLMHEAVTAALKSSGHFMRINWNYPWIIAARALGNDPDEFPAMAQMVEIAKADLVQTTT